MGVFLLVFTSIGRIERNLFGQIPDSRVMRNVDGRGDKNVSATPTTPSRARYTVSSVAHGLLHTRSTDLPEPQNSGIRKTGDQNIHNLNELR